MDQQDLIEEVKEAVRAINMIVDDVNWPYDLQLERIRNRLIDALRECGDYEFNHYA